MPAAPPPSWPAAFTRAARVEVDRLVADVRGRVLDLGMGLEHLTAYAGSSVDEVVVLEPDPVRAALLERRADTLGVPLRVVVSGLDDLPDDLAPVDTVVSALELVAVVAVDETLARLRALLDRAGGPGGRLLTFEPVPDHRRSVRSLSAAAASFSSARELHLERALPSAIRAAGFTITDLERITMPTLLWPLRHAVRLVAIPTPEIGGGAG